MAETATDAILIEDSAPVLHVHACEACGAPLDDADKFCNACGAPQAQAEAVQVEVAPEPQKHFRCENCGAEVATDPDQRSYVCPFCDSTYVVEVSPEASRRQPPEFVIGFAVTPEQAQEKFQRWISENGWFQPGDLKMAKIEQKLKGVYLPFWSFSMLAQSRWSASIGEYWYRTETYTTRENGRTVTKTRRVRETEWWPLAGRHHEYYSGYLVSGSRGLPQQDADRINPFHLAALKRYQPYFLAGWLNEEYTVDRPQALAQCQQEFQRREQQNVAAFLPGDTHRSLDVQTAFSNINSDLILLPVYLLSYRHGDKLYRFLINGQTGRVAGDKPMSWTRVGTLVAIVLAIIALVALAVFLFGQTR